MVKSTLPTIPEMLKESNYKQSGKVSFIRYIPLMLLAIILAPIIAIIGFFASNVLLGLIVAFVYYVESLRVSVFIFGVVILFASGLAVGAAIAAMLYGLLRAAKCRSVFWAAIASLLVIGVVIAVMLTRQARTIAVVPLLWPGFFGFLGIENSIHQRIGGIPIPFDERLNWVDGLYAIEGFIAVFFTGILSAVTPFCENCNRWYKGEKSIKLPVGNAQQLLDSLTDKSLHLSREDIYPLTDYPYLKVDMNYCERCDVSDIQLSAEIAEKGSGDKPKLDPWFRTMVKGKRANALLRALTGIERPSRKK